MKNSQTLIHRRAPTLSSIGAAALLAACGGGGGSSPPTLLVGTAAVGAAMAGATITVVDADPSTTDPAPVQAAADGSYSIDVSGLSAPLLVRASGTVDGESIAHSALVPLLNAETQNQANVTPLTSAVAALLAPGGDVAAFTTRAALTGAATTAKVDNASNLLVNTLRSDAATAALLGSNFNPLTTPFSANGSGVDAALQRVSIEASGGTLRITNLVSAAGENGAAAAVVLTPAMVATPNAAPALPASVPSANLPSAAELAALASKLQACLALPIAQRVSTDASGTVTAVLGACNAVVPTGWRSNGRSFAEDFGQFTLTKGQLSGAQYGSATVVLALNPDSFTDPKVIKHPYCNDGPCVVARFAATSASGRPVSADWLLGKVAGAWAFVGNQRPYRMFVEPRLYRRVNLNRDGAAAGNTSDPYFFKDRFESVLRLTFDPSVGSTNDVRAVRFTGPGLPTAGVVQYRSQRCGTDDRFGISNQVGSTRVTGSTALQFWTGGSGVDFTLAAANLDGTALAMPVPVNNATTASFQDFSPAPVADVSGQVAAWSRYKIEIFQYSSNSETPDQIAYVRINSAGENPASGPGVAWPVLDPAYATSRLTPTGAQAAAITGFADTLSWSIAAGNYVSSAYLFGSNFATATNSQNESASFAYRGRLDHEPVAYGQTSGVGWRTASPVASAAMSTYTQTAGTNPNPRCGVTQVPALTSNASDYREAGLLSRGPDRQLRQAVWFWDN